MKTHTHNTKKGFIALFFTLGISSILMAYVSASSSSIFDFIRSREYFLETRFARYHILQCADEYIDVMMRSIYTASITYNVHGCTISHVEKKQIHQDMYEFSFMSEYIFVKGTVRYGRIFELTYSNFSL